MAALLWGFALPAAAQTTKKSNGKVSIYGFSNLNSIVHYLDAICPLPFGAAGEIVSCKLADDYVVFESVVDEGIVNIDALKDNPDAVRKNLESTVTNATDYLDTLYHMMADQGKGYKLTYRGKTSGKTFTISLTGKQMKELVSKPSKASNPLEVLTNLVEVTNIQMPMTIAEGLIIDKVYVDDKYFVYNCVTDEELYSIDLLNSNFAETEFDVRDIVDFTDPTVVNTLETCVAANKGLAYRYVGNKSGKTATMAFSASDIKKALKQSAK